MKKALMVGIVVLTPVVLVVVLTQSVAADAAPHSGFLEAGLAASTSGTECRSGRQTSGAEYLICVPSGWGTGDDLLVYAHGYMAPGRDVEIPREQMVIDGVSITQTVTSFLGHAFATTSYYTNGLAVQPAISDLMDLVDIFSTEVGTPKRVYLVGVSEGGLITALSVEEHPEIYDGGLAMCGPYGDFQGQINHFGDFRVVFDYFFPGLMPGSAITIPENLDEEWEGGFFSDTVKGPVEASENMTKVTELLQVTGVSPYTYDPPTSTESIERLLWYNVFATEDGKAKLGGQPFDNQDRVYEGSNDDAPLNDGVERFSADPAALRAVSETYQTTGDLGMAPLVTLHTTGDPVVPYWHATQCTSKIMEAGRSGLHENREVKRHGHCAFTAAEILNAFYELDGMVSSLRQLFLPMILKGA
jgi:pimeloyl-ACP methyl ester carboxylesterase